MKHDGGFAFPSLERVEKYDDGKGQYIEHFAPMGGMSLRDYFAAQAVARMDLATIGEMVHDAGNQDDIKKAIEVTAIIAYELADAMLAERSKR